MTRNDTDERFEVSEISRRGAHRARPNALTGVLPVLALAVLVVGVVGLAYLFFGRSSGSSSSEAGATTTAGTKASSSASAQAGSSAAANPSGSADAGSMSSGTVDKTIVLNFYNGSSPNVPGLSRKASSKLSAQGWKIGTILPWTGAAVDRTTIFYASADQLPTARAVAKVLGVGSVKLNTVKASQGLAVVVGNDFTP